MGYCRVSTQEQVANGVSLDAQAGKITDFCRLYELELTQVIHDPGISAKNLNRPGLTVALILLRTKQVGGIVVAKLDRLTREIGGWQTLLHDYFGEKPGKRLFSVSDHVDTRSAMGRMLLNIQLAVSQGERELIGERTRDALGHKRKDNKRVGALRFGWDIDPATPKGLIVNEDEQTTIRLMQKLRAEGMSYRAIADELTAHSVAAKNGGKWKAGTVHYVLRSMQNA